MSKNKSRKKQSRSVWSKTALLLLGCCAVNLPLAYAENYMGEKGKGLTIFNGQKESTIMSAYLIVMKILLYILILMLP